MSEVTQHAISRFPVPELADMPEDIRERILAVQEKAGFVPNVFLVLAHRPEEFRAFFGLSNRMANVTSMRPNDEFYSLGRQPR
ncbi:alkylhydroperoxidase family enzyme [Marinobacterium sp. MBR-109]|jgi:alkylhydroperoxidase family enzyme